MSKEQNFLIKYGLHNFVICAPMRGKRVFSIKSTESQEMIGHAKGLIKGSFGEAAEIQVV